MFAHAEPGGIAARDHGEPGTEQGHQHVDVEDEPRLPAQASVAAGADPVHAVETEGLGENTGDALVAGVEAVVVEGQGARLDGDRRAGEEQGRAVA